MTDVKTDVKKCQSQLEWDEIVLQLGGHPLQLWGWGDVKEAHGWSVVRLTVYEDNKLIGAAQLLRKPLPQPLGAFVYIPRGPMCTKESREVVLDALVHHVKQHGNAALISIEPQWDDMPPVQGWKKAKNNVLVAETIIIDLSVAEDALLADMTKKTRQYIRKSEKEAIEIRQTKSREEVEACLALYKETGKRAGFALHDDNYYVDVKEMLGDHSPIFVATHANKPIAFLWLAISESVAFELYGGMNELGQQLRANYMLKWHAIQTMKKWGIKQYDVNGLLNEGGSSVKKGFASHETTLIGAFDYPLSRLYPLWSVGLPFAKKMIRSVKSLRK